VIDVSVLATSSRAPYSTAASDALRAYVVVDPNLPDASCRALDEAYRADLAVGAKLHCSYASAPTTSRACLELVHAVAERGRLLLVHVDGPDWSGALLEVAQAHPRSREVFGW
jgi:predicted TIM-barrel fold metal-dependent hydrolase